MAFGKDEVKSEAPEKAFTASDMLEFAKTFAAELKKPSADEQEKKDAEKKRLLMNQQNSISQAKAEEAQKLANESACSHMKPHPYQGKTRIVAPFHSDGLHHPLCLFCRKEFKPFPPGNDTLQPGTSLDDYSGVTPQLIMQWGERHEAKQKAQPVTV